MHHGYWNDGWMNGWSWIPMAAMMILFWGGLIWLGITVLRRTTATPHAAPGVGAPPPPAASSIEPAQILAERLARGEIEVDDYRTRLDALRGPQPDR